VAANSLERLFYAGSLERRKQVDRPATRLGAFCVADREFIRGCCCRRRGRSQIPPWRRAWKKCDFRV